MSRSISVTTIGACLLLGALGSLGISPEAQAATLTPTNCNDSGAGSLRAAVASAVAWDTIDLRPLTCRRIVLTSGAIDMPQGWLTVRGPGHARFSISGNWATRVFRHTGEGTLSLRGVTIEQGQHRADTAEGGCLWSFGNLDLNDVHVRHCAAYAKFGAVGGGMYAEGNITLFFSAVYSNGARGAGSNGGGLMAGRVLEGPRYKGGHVRVHRSRIFDNTAGIGGAMRANNGLDMTYSTVSGNHARTSIGGLEILRLDTGRMRIAFSTISGNSAEESVGALNFGGIRASIYNTTISGNTAPFLSVGELDNSVSIVNSTIAFNSSTTPFGCEAAFAVSWETHIDSSIIGHNTCNGASFRDIRGPGGPQPPPTWIVGANNLIEDSAVPVPDDTITGLDPQLGALADNGGRTWTHRPLSGSPAIDRGNNAAGLEFDQRGEGFPRVVNGRADIGAFER